LVRYHTGAPILRQAKSRQCGGLSRRRTDDGKPETTKKRRARRTSTVTSNRQLTTDNYDLTAEYAEGRRGNEDPVYVMPTKAGIQIHYLATEDTEDTEQMEPQTAS
jgi:hypothetical protein